MKCSIKRRNLPPAPKPTRPIIVKEVQGTCPNHLEVREKKSPVVIQRRRKPVEAIKVSTQKKMAEKEARKKKAIEMYRAGMSIDAIANEMGVLPGAIYDYTRSIRLGEKPISKYAPYFDRAEKLYKRGASYKEIADKLGLARTQAETVLAILRKENRIGRRNVWVARRR